MITPGSIELISTGISVEPVVKWGRDGDPSGQHFYPEAQVRSRSGLAAKNGVFVLNSPGTIDYDYRGEIKVILANFGKEVFTVHEGDRIAQLVFTFLPRVQLTEVDGLVMTERGEGGFGSTGVS